MLVAPKQIWKDCDKRHRQERLLWVHELVIASAGPSRAVYARCIVLSNGEGRPARMNATHERIGTGSVGKFTLINVTRMDGKLYACVFVT